MHEARSKQQLLATLEAIRDTVRYIEEQDDEPLEPVDVLAILETRMGADWLGQSGKDGSMTSDPTREVGIGIAALVLAGFSLGGSIAALIVGGWWLLALVLLVPLIAVCGYGAAESFTLAERDEQGTPIPDGR